MLPLPFPLKNPSGLHRRTQQINLKVSYNRGITENFSEKD